MATSHLLKKETETFSGATLTKYLNEEKGTNYKDLPAALLGVGASVAGAILIGPLAAQIATALGLALGISTVIDVVESGMDEAKLAPVLEKVGANGTLEVTTSFYEWLSGSGNHTGYYSETIYRAI